MSPALEAVEAIYFNAQLRLSDMLAACPTDEDRTTIRGQYVLARHNYFTCINKTFHDDDPALETAVAQAKTAADAIKKIDEQLGKISAVIAAMTTAVEYGSQIVKKIITL